MKAVICLMCVAVAAASPFIRYIDSFEDGFHGSVEYIPQRNGNVARFRSMNRAQKVEELQRLLNAGAIDTSDENIARTLLTNPERLGHPEFFVDHSGEIKFFAPQTGYAPAAGGSQTGGNYGTGVQAVKK